MTVLIDSWAWIEYFKGSSAGEKVRNILESNEEIITATINISEVYNFLLKNKLIDSEKLIEFMISSSFAIQLDTEIAMKASRIKLKEKMGLADAIVAATAEVNNAKILTGDDDFKNFKDVIFIDK